MKTEQESEASAPVAGRWLRDADGQFSSVRVFGALLLVALGAAVIVGLIPVSVPTSPWLGVVLTAGLGAALALRLIVEPLARGYEVSLKSHARPATNSTIDPLTGIPNQRGITSHLLDAMSYAGRYGHPLSVALVDLDLLRDINRMMGHKAGDKALQTVAAVYTETLRMPDRAGRYGDEEFLVILPNTTLKNATQIAERIREGVENADCNLGGKKVPVTVSIGASQYRKGEDLERFLSRVDKALAQAKASGRNRVVAD